MNGRHGLFQAHAETSRYFAIIFSSMMTYHMEAFSALLAICEENSLVTGNDIAINEYVNQHLTCLTSILLEQPLSFESNCSFVPMTRPMCTCGFIVDWNIGKIQWNFSLIETNLNMFDVFELLFSQEFKCQYPASMNVTNASVTSSPITDTPSSVTYDPVVNGKGVCAKTMLVQFAVMNVLHTISYLYSLYSMRCAEPEQFVSLLERVRINQSINIDHPTKQPNNAVT